MAKRKPQPKSVTNYIQSIDGLQKIELGVSLLLDGLKTIGGSNNLATIENDKGQTIASVAGVVDPAKAAEFTKLYKRLDAKWMKQDEAAEKKAAMDKVLRTQQALVDALEQAEESGK